MALIVSLLGVLFARTITRPVHQLVKGTKEFGQGNLEYRVEVKTEGEIGQLVDSFNTMATERKLAEEELTNHREHLEALVEERTAELTKANEELQQEIAGRKQIGNALRRSEENFAEAQEIAKLGSYAWNIPTNEVAWSDQMYRNFGHKPGEISPVYETFLSHVHPDEKESVEKEIEASLNENKSFDLEFRFIKKDGTERVMHAQGALHYDESGKPVRMVGTGQDVSERVQAEEQIKATLAEKEVLLREVHHRVKNNLQVLIYLIDMQAEAVKDPEVLHTLEELQGRTKAMALIHEKLYQSESLAQIDFDDYLQDLTINLLYAQGDGRAISLHVDATNIFLNVNVAIPCGMIVNELVTNALKHAFPVDDAGASLHARPEIRIEFSSQEGEYVLIVSDNGIGLPPEFDWRKTDSLGLKLVNIWATHQLNSTLEVDTQHGTTFKIRFTVKKGGFSVRSEA